MSPTPPTGPRPTTLTGAMLTLKIMHGAFMAGVGLFAIVVLVLQATASAAPAPPATPPASDAEMQRVFAFLLGAYALTVLPATLFILPAMRKRAGIEAADADTTTDPDAPKLATLNLFTTALILRAAMVEGWGLFGAVAALLTENRLFLIVPGIAVAVIALYFPTLAKFERFYSEALEKASKDAFQ